MSCFCFSFCLKKSSSSSLSSQRSTDRHETPRNADSGTAESFVVVEPSFSCRHRSCQRRRPFHSQELLLSHIKLNHSHDNVNLCQLCGLRVKDSTLMSAHTQDEHGDGAPSTVPLSLSHRVSSPSHNINPRGSSSSDALRQSRRHGSFSLVVAPSDVESTRQSSSDFESDRLLHLPLKLNVVSVKEGADAAVAAFFEPGQLKLRTILSGTAICCAFYDVNSHVGALMNLRRAVDVSRCVEQLWRRLAALREEMAPRTTLENWKGTIVPGPGTLNHLQRRRRDGVAEDDWHGTIAFKLKFLLEGKGVVVSDAWLENSESHGGKNMASSASLTLNRRKEFEFDWDSARSAKGK